MDSRGFTFMEVMVAASLLLVVFFALANVYMYGRRQTVYEEDRRRASAVAEARLEALRRDYVYDSLPGLDGTTTTSVVDGRTYTVKLAVTAESPQPSTTTVTDTVTWNATVGTTTVPRSLTCTTILARSVLP